MDRGVEGSGHGFLLCCVLSKTLHSHNVTLFTGAQAGFCGVKMLWYPVEGEDPHLEWSRTIIRPMPQDIKGTSNDIDKLYGVLNLSLSKTGMTFNKLPL